MACVYVLFAEGNSSPAGTTYGYPYYLKNKNKNAVNAARKRLMCIWLIKFHTFRIHL